MKRRVLALLTVSAVLGLAGTAIAGVIGFDDVVVPQVDGWIDLASPYQGFAWTPAADWEVISTSLFKTYGNSFGAPSLENAVYNGNGAGTVVVSVLSGDFDFLGAYFSSFTENNALQNYSSGKLTITGKNDGSPVGSVTLDLGVGFNWYAINLKGIDSLEFAADGAGRYWLMDNFTYETPGSAPVPEPGTLLLLGTGLAGMAGFRARKLVKK